MKLVGITQRVAIEPKYSERRDALDQRWSLFLYHSGFCLVPIPNQPQFAIEFADSTALSGIILSGGNDLAAYGGDTPERDATEEQLLHWARRKEIPLLGICRGMQVILHDYGVKLHRSSDHVTAAHPATIHGVSRDVNSYHGFVADETVPELEVWGRAWDGTIEAIRHRRSKVAGFMWHPERNAPFDERDLRFVRSFFGTN